MSRYFKLGRVQGTLDFVDVDTESDVPVFIDPMALSLLSTDWAHECQALIDDFFSTILELINAKNNASAIALLASLNEPNETHLGMSQGRSQGTAIGPDFAKQIFQKMAGSKAVTRGLITHLEESALMIPGIDRDRISDVTTNIIRGPLILYTQAMCQYYGIPTNSGVPTGPCWNPRRHTWEQTFSELPCTSYGSLLLVPKIIVRRKLSLDAGEYYTKYIIPYLRQEEQTAASSLSRIANSKQKRITRKFLENKYGAGKLVNEEHTLRNPELLQQYRDFRKIDPRVPLNHAELAECVRSDNTDYDALLREVLKVKTGRASAKAYEDCIEKLLSAVFYPSLTHPKRESKLHDGRKRVDIDYANAATTGFFYWTSLHYPCAKIFVECKNYESDPSNPEMDQLAGRFSPSRGQVGLLVCRKIANKHLLLKRCRDTARDSRGYIVPLDDDDMLKLISQRKNLETPMRFDLLQERFNYLIS